MSIPLAILALTAFVIVLFGICAFICGGRSEPLDEPCSDFTEPAKSIPARCGIGSHEGGDTL